LQKANFSFILIFSRKNAFNLIFFHRNGIKSIEKAIFKFESEIFLKTFKFRHFNEKSNFFAYIKLAILFVM